MPGLESAKRTRVDEPHVAPLNELVRRWREPAGRPSRAVPWFDPDGGGVGARVLLLMESSGPRTVAAGDLGFSSEDNEDPTSRRLRRLRAGSAPRAAFDVSTTCAGTSCPGRYGPLTAGVAVLRSWTSRRLVLRSTSSCGRCPTSPWWSLSGAPRSRGGCGSSRFPAVPGRCCPRSRCRTRSRRTGIVAPRPRTVHVVLCAELRPTSCHPRERAGRPRRGRRSGGGGSGDGAGPDHHDA